MKVYKYYRFAQSWHWSQDVGEDLIYIPEAKVILYDGGNANENYKGITTDSKFLKEAEEYVSEVQNGIIKKYINEEHEEISERLNKDKFMSQGYSQSTLSIKDKTYLKEIPQHSVGKTTFAPVSLNGYKEIELNITLEEIQEIVKQQKKFDVVKKEFEDNKKTFEKNISKINKLIKNNKG